jgi:hypothetical protein
MTDDYLSQGIAAVKAGQKQEARRLLDAAIKAAPNDERTWGWFYNVASNDEERLRCVKEILRINPNNEKSKQKYDELIGLDYQTSEPALKAAQNSKVNNAKSSQLDETKKGSISKIEWVIIGVLGGVAILIVAIVGILFLSQTLKAASATIPTNLPASIANPLIAQPSPQPSTLNSIPALTDTPLPSQTQAPTVTDTPLSTPTTAPTIKPSLGTFNNPVPIGIGYKFPGFGTLTVINSSWLSGQTGFAIVKLSFSCERPADQKCDTGNFMLDALGGSGNGYKQEFDTAIPNPTFGTFDNPPVYGGGVENGYAGFLVTNSESALIMRVQLFLQDGEFYFKISS